MWSISPPIRGPLPPFQHLARWEGGAQKPSLVSIQSCFLEGLRQVKEGRREAGSHRVLEEFGGVTGGRASGSLFQS